MKPVSPHCALMKVVYWPDAPGHTEATVDLARLPGMSPAGVLVEILKEDGEMALKT